MAKPPQQPLDGRSGSIAGIMSMLGAQNTGAGRGGIFSQTGQQNGGSTGQNLNRPMYQGPMVPGSGFNFPPFQQWLSSIGVTGPLTPEQTAQLFAQYEQSRYAAMSTQAAAESGMQSRRGTPFGNYGGR